MRAEADDLVAHLFLEAYNDSDRENHHGQPQGNANHGDAHGRRRDFPFSFLAGVDTLGDVKLVVHASLSIFPDKPPALWPALPALWPGLLSSAHRRGAPRSCPVPVWYRSRMPGRASPSALHIRSRSGTTHRTCRHHRPAVWLRCRRLPSGWVSSSRGCGSTRR